MAKGGFEINDYEMQDIDLEEDDDDDFNKELDDTLNEYEEDETSFNHNYSQTGEDIALTLSLQNYKQFLIDEGYDEFSITLVRSDFKVEKAGRGYDLYFKSEERGYIKLTNSYNADKFVKISPRLKPDEIRMFISDYKVKENATKARQLLNRLPTNQEVDRYTPVELLEMEKNTIAVLEEEDEFLTQAEVNTLNKGLTSNHQQLLNVLR